MEIREITDKELRREWNRRFYLKPGAQLKSARDSVEHLRSLFSNVPRDQEHFGILLLNQQNQIIESIILFSGTINTSAVYPRELVKLVFKHEAASVLIAHTHPSGCTQPSSSDKAVTTKISKLLSNLDVELIDHLVLGNGVEEYFSFADHRML
jgi:DNA repair protein RadC